MSNPLYIAGHSYGGIYAPYHAWLLHQHNERMTALDPVGRKGTYNLKGLVIANGITTFMFDGYYGNAIENLAMFNHIPLQTFMDYQSLGC
jgi:carboxypeptidase C (cathepsin A)